MLSIRARARSPVVAAALLLSVSGTVSAQNLVTNPGFESGGCPKTINQIKRSDPWDTGSNTTPDYFGSCSSNPLWSVPANTRGNQAPRAGGSRYAGIYGWASFGNFEYVQQQLSSPLAPNTSYAIEFWVSLAETSESSVDNLGAVLSAQRIGGNTQDAQMRASGHVRNPPGQQLNDSTGWTLIQGVYTTGSTGGEEWLTIGPFGARNDSQDGPGAFHWAYYYLDDVSVCAPAAIARYTVPETVCEGSPIVLTDAGSESISQFYLEVLQVAQVGDTTGAWINCGKTIFTPFPATLDLMAECPLTNFTPGVYMVKIAAQNTCTSFNPTLDWFTVQPASCCTMAANVTPPGPIDACGNLVLTANPSGGVVPYSYQWVQRAGDPVGLETPGSQTLNLTPSIEASFQAVVTDAVGCDAQSNVVDVRLADGHAEMQLANHLCEGETLWMDASGSFSDAWQYEIHETDAVGSQTVVPGTLFESTSSVGSPGLVDLSASYAFAAGKVYRVALHVDSCSVGGTAERWVTVSCCGDCAEPAPGLVGWWAGEADTLDRSPYANDGTPAAGLSYTTGRVNQAFQQPLLAPAGIVSVPDDASLDFGASGSDAGDFSIDAWIQSNLYLDETVVIVSKEGGLGYAFGLYSEFLAGSAAHLFLDLTDGTGTTRYESDDLSSLLTTQWHHVAVTVDRESSEGITFYLDGADVGLADPTGQPGDLSNASSLSIGGLSGSQIFPKKLDEVEIWNREVHETDIAAIYDAGTGGKCREHCGLDAVTSFCPGDTSRNATARVCNHTRQVRAYHVSFHALAGEGGQTGQGCNVDGPMGFTPQSTNVVLLPGECQDVTVAVDAPAAFATPLQGQTGCYVVQIRNTNLDLLSGGCASCQGVVRQLVDVCSSAGDPPTLVINPTGPRPADFSVESLIGSTPFDYTLLALPAGGGEPLESLVSLDAQPPGDPVSGSTVLPGSGGTTVSVQAQVETLQAFGFEDLLLLADVTGDGVPETIASISLRSVLDAAADVPATGAAGLAVLVLLALAAGRRALRSRPNRR